MGLSKSSTMAFALTMSGCPLAVEAFSPGIASFPDQPSALRGTVSEAQLERHMPASDASSSSFAHFAVFAGAAALAGRLGARQSRVARKAAVADAAEQPVEMPVFDPSKQIGVTQPLGFFDPLGFAEKGDEANFRILRAAELKHGRVAMMASVGAVAQHYVVFPGFDNVPRGMGAVTEEIGAWGFALLFVLSGWLELDMWKESEDREPGNFGDPFGVNMYNEDMRNKELNNGRAAMFAVVGIIAANLATGKDAIQQFGF